MPSASPFAGDSEMAARMREFDWSSTPLGSPRTWPESLQTTCRICLTSRLPILLWYGPQLLMLYNDASVPVLGHRHPALAEPGARTWADVWPIVGPELNPVLAGEATRSDDLLLPTYRRGYREEAYFTLSHSPVHDEHGGVGGIVTAVTETTATVLGQRRLRTLRELADISATVAPTVEQVLKTALNVLARNRADVPHAVTYLLDEDGRERSVTPVGSYGVVPDPAREDSVRRVARTGAAELVTGLPVADALPDSASPVGDTAADSSMLLPVTPAGQDRPVAVLSAAVSPYRELDEEYRSFFELVGGQLAAAVTGAPAGTGRRPRGVTRVDSDLREAGFRRAVLDSLQEGFFVTDAGGTITEVNTAFERMIGYGPEGLPYHYPYPWLVDPDEDLAGREASDAARRTVAAEGSGEFVLPVRHHDGHRLWAAVSVAVVPGDSGHRIAVGTARDVTAERAAMERESTLARFSEALAGAFGVTEVVTAGLAELQAAFDSAWAVTVFWSDDGADASVVGTAAPSSWQRLDRHSRDALCRTRQLPTGQVTVWPAPGAPGRAVVIAAPLGDDAAVALGFDAPRRLTVEDRTLFGTLTGHLTRVLARAHSYDDARNVALTLQRSILGPIDLPPAFAVRYEPATQPMEVGGDWYDVVMLPAGRTGIVVGDCVGRGLPAAAVMGQLRSACRALLLRATGPRQVLTELDDFAGRIEGAKCSTVFCAIVDPAENTVRYSCAGHLPAVLSNPDGSTELLDEARSLPLGVEPGRRRLEASASLQPGATLLLYTDGLVERRGMSLDVGLGAIRQLVNEHGDRAPEEIADLLLAARQPGSGFDDDVAVLVYRHPPRPLHLELAAEPVELARVRCELRRWLATGLIPAGVADDAVLAVDEACSNAIEHGTGTAADHRVTITARLAPERLTLAVSDTGSWKPPAADPLHRGRGIILMRHILDEVSIDCGAPGTTVRMAKAL